jgi:hypothetical protein
MGFKNIFKTGKPHLIKLVTINHHFAGLIQQDLGELREL